MGWQTPPKWRFSGAFLSSAFSSVVRGFHGIPPQWGYNRGYGGRGMALSDVKIRTAKPKAHRYRLTDSHGLSIEVSPSSTPSEPKKYWRYRYRLGGKEN